MAKNKDRSEVEHLKGIIRQQKSIIKNLRKSVSRKNKKERNVEELEQALAEEYLKEEAEEIQIPIKQKDRCSKCQGETEEVDLVVKWLVICQSCDFRFTRKK